MRETLADELPAQVLGDVKLLVSELATNSVRHAGCDEGETLEIEADVTDECIRVRLRDHGDGFESHRPEPPRRGATGGYGLVLLDRLADRWGIQRNGGFCVWFEVARPPVR